MRTFLLFAALALAALVCLASLAPAADPPAKAKAPTPKKLGVSGADTVPEHKLGKLLPTDAPADAVFFWLIPDEDKLDVTRLPDGTLLFTGPPGTYKVFLMAVWIDEDTKKQQGAQKTGTITITADAAKKAAKPPEPTAAPVRRVVGYTQRQVCENGRCFIVSDPIYE